MTLCNNNHSEVCFIGTCPVCELVCEMEKKLAELEHDNIELIGTVDSLKAKLETTNES